MESAGKNAASLTMTSEGNRVQRMLTGPRTAPPAKQTENQRSGQHAAQGPRLQQSSSGSSFKRVIKCHSCRQIGHVRRECKYQGYKGTKGNFCGKKNHLAKVCRAKLQGKSNLNNVNIPKNNYTNQNRPNNKVHNKHNFANAVEQVQNEEVYDISALFQMCEIRPKPEILKVAPFRVEVMVVNEPINFEIDSGASVSVCNEKFYETHLSNLKLDSSDFSLSAYTNVPIEPVGKVNVNVKYKGLNKNLVLYVIKNGAHPLMGRDWMKALQIE